MEADQDKTYALIQDGLVHQIFDIATLPVWNDDLTVVDITSIQPVPQLGWGYDGSAFSAPATPTLEQLQAAQIGILATAYNSAITQAISFKTAGNVTASFQADTVSQQNLANLILAFGKAGVTPSGFYWVTSDNSQVPFTYADLQGLAAAMGAQGWAAFQNMQVKKAAVLAATTATQVSAVTW